MAYGIVRGVCFVVLSLAFAGIIAVWLFSPPSGLGCQDMAWGSFFMDLDLSLWIWIWVWFRSDQDELGWVCLSVCDRWEEISMYWVSGLHWVFVVG